MEAENKDFAARYVEVEEENNNLANLYVASYQLHSTLDVQEVLKIILEIIINLIGAEKFALMVLDEELNELVVAATEGIDKRDIPNAKVGEGLVGAVAKTGESFFEKDLEKKRDELSEPLVCIPLKIKEHVIGVIVVFTLLLQKRILQGWITSSSQCSQDMQQQQYSAQGSMPSLRGSSQPYRAFLSC